MLHSSCIFQVSCSFFSAPKDTLATIQLTYAKASRSKEDTSNLWSEEIMAERD